MKKYLLIVGLLIVGLVLSLAYQSHTKTDSLRHKITKQLNYAKDNNGSPIFNWYDKHENYLRIESLDWLYKLNTGTSNKQLEFGSGI
ncbi:MAG: hypothetical protein LBC17_00585, partial [Lactobacillaceae bacterium]|nr:hypothetical protein [Lactobacillaceae bacterium]